MVCHTIASPSLQRRHRSIHGAWWSTMVLVALVMAANPSRARGAMSLMAGDDVDAQDARLVSAYFDADAEKLGFSPTGKNGEGADVSTATAAIARLRRIDMLGARLVNGDSGLTVEVVIAGADGTILGAATGALESADDRKSLRKVLARVVQAYRKRGPSVPAPAVVPAPTPAPDVEPPPPPPVTAPPPEKSAAPATLEAPSPPADSPPPAGNERPVVHTATATVEGDNPWVTPLALIGSAVGLAGAAVGCGLLAQGNVDAIREGRADDVQSARLGAIVGATAADAMTTTAIGVGALGIVAAIMTMAGPGPEPAAPDAAPL